MGQSQSSHSSNDHQTPTAKGSVPVSVRGRKSVTAKIHKPSPHGLRASVVSEPSVPDFDAPDVEHTSVADEEEEEDFYEEISSDEESSSDEEEEGKFDHQRSHSHPILSAPLTHLQPFVHHRRRVE